VFFVVRIATIFNAGWKGGMYSALVTVGKEAIHLPRSFVAIPHIGFYGTLHRLIIEVFSMVESIESHTHALW
jgi:hypothetical protein